MILKLLEEQIKSLHINKWVGTIENYSTIFFLFGSRTVLTLPFNSLNAFGMTQSWYFFRFLIPLAALEPKALAVTV